MPWKPLAILCALILIPYLFLGFYNHPSADDYTYANPVMNVGFWQAQWNWYQTWSGRYVSTALLSLSPVAFGSFAGYKLIGITSFLLYLATSYFFLSVVLKRFLGSQAFRVFYVLFMAVLLSGLPSITESFHWFPGVVNYTYAFMVFLLGGAAYLKARKLEFPSVAPPRFGRGGWGLSLGLTLASVLLAGFNETLVLLWLYLLLVALVAMRVFVARWDRALMAPLVFGVLAFYVVYQAPGNAVRAAQFQGNHDLLFTLFRPLGLFVEIFFRYLKPPLVIFLLLCLPEILRRRPQVSEALYSPKARWFTLGFFVSLVFLFLAPAHWAIGGAPPRRAMNLIYFVHAVFVLLMFCQWVWSQPHKWSRRGEYLLQKSRPKTLAGVFVLSLLVFGNHGVAWGDLFFRAPRYAAQQEERLQQLRAAPRGSELSLAPLRVRPETLYFSDMTTDPADWINASMAAYFGLKSLRAVEPARNH